MKPLSVEKTIQLSIIKKKKKRHTQGFWKEKQGYFLHLQQEMAPPLPSEMISPADC